MDLDEWYETVQRWRAPATRPRWRRVPAAAAAALVAVVIAAGAAQLGDGSTGAAIEPLAAAPLGLPVEDVENVEDVEPLTTLTVASPSIPGPPPTTVAAPVLTAPPVTAATPAPTKAPAPPPPQPAAASKPAPPPTTAPPAPGPPSNTGRLSARLGANPRSVAPGQPITFSAGWTDSNGQLASMGIEFGDGSGDSRSGAPCGPGPSGPRSGDASFSHAYPAPGTYTVRLHVHTDDCAGGMQGTVVALTVRVR